MKVGDEVYLRDGTEEVGRITFSKNENGVEIYYVNFRGLLQGIKNQSYSLHQNASLLQ